MVVVVPVFKVTLWLATCSSTMENPVMETFWFVIGRAHFEREGGKENSNNLIVLIIDTHITSILKRELGETG